MLNVQRKRLDVLLARDCNEPLKTSEQYNDIFIHTFQMKLSEKHYNCLYKEKFPKSNLKHFTMFKEFTADEEREYEPFVISKLDGVSETYNDARPYISVFYNFKKEHGEKYSVFVKSVYDQSCEPLEVVYLRDFGSRIVLFRDNPSNCKDLLATGTWKIENDNTGHYYLGCTQLNDKHTETTNFHLQDNLAKSDYQTEYFVMFTSISKYKEVYDIQHIKNFVREFGASLIVDQRFIETFVNGPRVT